jgi:hypothetical protein
MCLLDGPVHLIWSIVMLPLHLLAWLVKYIIIVPFMSIVVLILMVVACVGIAIPGSLLQITLPTIAAPAAVNNFASGLKTVVVPQSPSVPAAPTQVNCVTESNAIVVRWIVQSNDGAQWYQVMRRPVRDETWYRITLTSARDGVSGQYEFRDTTTQHGVTYLYGVMPLAQQA